MSLIEVKSFLASPPNHDIAIVDVRTPAEFSQGHIPQAINIPLLSDDERVVVGTVYKKDGAAPAFDDALSFVGPKMSMILEQLREIKSNKLVIYCWRGGMRSASIVWLCKMAGLDVVQLQNGYKGYRQYIRTYFAQEANIYILGGRTGVGKTRILKELAVNNEQVLDLEGIAHHLGSSFGKTTDIPQPSNEQFENNCFDMWKTFDLTKRIWVESESRNIGKVSVVEPLFLQMRAAPMLYVETTLERRVDHIVGDYAEVPLERLVNACTFIKKKIGDERYNEVVSFIKSGQLKSAIKILLSYYDALYDKTAKKNQRETENIVWGNCSVSEFALECLLK